MNLSDATLQDAMDLRQYLIAPHERPRQQESTHHRMPDLDHQYYFTQPQPQHQAQHRSQHQSQEQGEPFTREQVISGLAAYPDLLASILRSGTFRTKVQEIDEDHENADKEPSISQSVCLNNALVPTQHAFLSPLTRSSSSNEASAPSSLTRNLTLSSAINKRSPKLCFWYYHTGACTSDPMSTTYNGGRVCSDLHALDGGQESRLHQGPWQWHKRFGNCGLELCRFSSNFKYRKDHQKKTASETNVVKGEARAAIPSSAAAAEGQEGDIKDTTLVPTSPRAGRHGKGQRLQLQQYQCHAPAATPLPLKRKASVLSSMATTDPTSSVKKARTSGVLTQSLITSSEYTPISTPTQPSGPLNNSAKPTAKPGKATQKAKGEALATAKPLDIITYTLPSGSHHGIPRSSHRKAFDATCFAWYHGKCPHRGNKCRYLHALTQPPSFVQPPRGFVHAAEGVKCTRDWCPGD